MDTQNPEPSRYELSYQDLDAVIGGACDIFDLTAAGGGPLEKLWVQQGCPVPKSK